MQVRIVGSIYNPSGECMLLLLLILQLHELQVGLLIARSRWKCRQLKVSDGALEVPGAIVETWEVQLE